MYVLLFMILTYACNQSEVYVGKLRSNTVGSKFTLSASDSGGHTNHLCTIKYESRLTATASELGPCRRVTVSLDAPMLAHPPPKLAVQRKQSSTTCNSFEDIRRRVFRSIEPEWMQDSACYGLDFGEMSVFPSVKNLVLANDQGERAVEFHKSPGKSKYNLHVFGGMDVSLSVAFGVAISSIHHKICTQ